MIRILTDSMSDICQEEAAAWGLEVLPLSVRFGQEEYLDGVELSREDFFRRMVASDELPKTSQISPERFRDAFERALSDPQDEVVHLFTGDSLFPGGPGNTEKDPQRFGALMDDLEARVFGAFPDSTWVYPGHGNDTTLGAERPSVPEWRARGW